MIGVVHDFPVCVRISSTLVANPQTKSFTPSPGLLDQGPKGYGVPVTPKQERSADG